MKQAVIELVITTFRLLVLLLVNYLSNYPLDSLNAPPHRQSYAIL